MDNRRETMNMNGPPAKRARTASRGDDDYRPGSIVEIEVENFMTYTYLKSRPGPRLNLIVGPNGTGKSTLVCAICLGLGGEAQLLGRAGHIGDFVKRGEDSGWTRISLRGDLPNEVLCITRKINKRNKSEWFFNDQSVTMRAIQEKMQKFNIQLDNLTQFLPQDRVCEFAKLSPVRLLEETEKAVGNPELFAKHQMLIQKSEEMKKIQTALTSHETQLVHFVTINAELEEDKQRMHQRTQLLEKAATMKKKLPWLKYEEKKGTFEEAKEAERVAKIKKQDLLRRSIELNSLFAPLQASRDKAKGASERLQGVKTQNEQKLRQIADYETELSAKVKAKFMEIQDAHKKETLLQDRIEKARKAVSDAAADLENLPEIKPQSETIKNLKAQVEELRMEGDDRKIQMQDKESLMLQRRRDYDQCNRRLQDINTVNTRLLQNLRNAGAHQINQAYEWVQSHRDQFRKQVFGPILLEVRVANKEYANYVEGHVPNYIWKAFITQDVEDRDLLVKNLKQFDVPIINQRNGQPRHAPRVTPAMMQLGITTRLDEVIEAPATVKTLLIGQTGLDFSFIGTSETNQRADQAFGVGVKDLWTPDNHYKWSGSRYGSHNSNDISAVRPSRLFSETVDLREKNELENRKAQLEGEMRQIEGEKSELNLQYRSLQEEAGKLGKQIDEAFHHGLRQKKRAAEAKNILEQRKKKLSALENEEGSTDAEHRLRALIKQINADRVQNLITLKERLMETAKTHTSYAAQHLQGIELDAKARELERDVRKQDLLVREAEVSLGQCKQVTENLRAQLARAKDLAEQIATLTPDLQQQFAEMPDAVQDLENAIADCEVQAAAVICNNENAILIYEQRCEQIRNLTLKADERRTALDRCMKEIESLESTWKPQLRELVFNINENFSQNFKEIAVAGEVSLDERGTDFDQYGILIKVKFRESANLQVLSAHHQSGGERSVSTILYLVSLQGLTYCPFRVVDEINQGMDPKNERKMFQQLVRAASQRNTPQCLLLTPKLLPDLNYTAACTILNIMNGPYVEEASANWKSAPTWSALSQMVRSQ